MHRTIQLSLLCFLVLPISLLIWQTLSGRANPVRDWPDLPGASQTATAGPQPAGSGWLQKDSAPVLTAFLQSASGQLSGSQQSFHLTAEAEGAIGYFSGQTNLQGDAVPHDPQRLLAGEMICLTLLFSAEPGQVEVRFAGQTWFFTGLAGQLQYQIGIIVPDQAETLRWDGTRLAEPMELQIQAIALQDSTRTALASLPGFEVTGHVRQLVQLQPVNP